MNDVQKLGLYLKDKNIKKSFRSTNGFAYENIEKFEGMPTKEELDTWWAENQANIEAERLEKEKTESLKKDFLDDNAEDFIRLVIRALKEVNESDSTIFSSDTKQKALFLIDKFREYKDL